MEKDKVSIVIPLYNSQKYIEKCVKSVLNQTYKNLEIFVINDGSTDNSLNVCNEIIDDRLTVITQNNFGAPAARNNGLYNITGKYVMLLDSDDFLRNDAIKNLYDTIERTNSELVYGRTIHVDENDNLLTEKILSPKVKLLNSKKNFYSIDPYPGNKLYRVDIIKKYNILFGNVRIGQDLNFYLKYVPFCKKIAFCDEIVSYYRVVETGISKTKNFNIFDITNSFKDVEKFYKINKIDDDNYEVLESIKIYHYINQMKKLRNFTNIIDRRIIYLYFCRNLRAPFKKGKIELKNKMIFKLKKLYLCFASFIPFIRG